MNLSTVLPPDIGPELKIFFENVKTWIERQSMSWEEIEAEFHHRLVCIHPFPNGNGRISRIMTEYLQKRNGRGISTWMSSLSASPTQRRQEYIEALQCADNGQV